MRLLAPLGLLVLLTACESVIETAPTLIGNPADGWLDYIGNTITFRSNPNRPQPESDNIRRVMGQPVDIEPLTSETGNIWPALPKREPTAVELEKAPPANADPAVKPAAMAPTAQPAAPMPVAAPAPAPTIPPATAITNGSALPTPSGNAILTSGANGVLTYTLPSGATGRAINNGNGTITLIGADGQVMSVPAPK
ncbi:MAG: hypothetical protein NT133_19725 [Alphaproteobacteria bacterium]|nr:hypothetical protein [Alphaproteobacteria bacterium]